MLEIRILGPLQACCNGEPLALPGLASRRVLAALALHPGEWLTSDRLIDELWGERPPPTVRKALQMHVSRLRAALAPGVADPRAVLAGGSGGYRLVADAIDAD